MSQSRFSLTGAVQSASTQLKARFALLAAFVGSMWVVFFVESVIPALHLDRYGVVPRTAFGLLGILFAPWLHGNLGHIMANTSGLLILGWLCMWPRISNFWEATVGAMLGSGLCAWLIGPSYSDHIGASGLVFGYAGYLVGRALYTRNFLAMLVALFVATTYGLSMFFGALPIYPGISWQMHVGGAIGGFIVARSSARQALNASAVRP